MKKLIVAALVLFSLSVHAQKKPVRRSSSPASTRTLTNSKDSLSYALGLAFANFYKQQKINLNTTLVAKAINDVQSNGRCLFSTDVSNEIIAMYGNSNVRQTVEEGRKFLEQNKKRSGVKTTASGLQYEILKDSTGPKPRVVDTVVVNYKGTLIDGTEFDNSYKRGEPIQFALNGVIKGWIEALQLMRVGSKYKIYLPYNLGYGLNGQGPIPGGSPLIFEVELLGIKPAK